MFNQFENKGLKLNKAVPQRQLGKWAAVLGLSLLLTGCSGQSQGTNASTTPARASSSTAPVISPTPSASSGSTQNSSNSCSSNPQSPPSAARTSSLTDLDGDGKKDVEWMESKDGDVQFGFLGSSGISAVGTFTSASGGTREVVVFKPNSGPILALVGDGRSASLFAYHDCAWVRPSNSNGQPYAFDENDEIGTGIGVGESEGKLWGYQARGSGENVEIVRTEVTVSADGLHASNGATSVLLKNTTSATAEKYEAITSSSSSVLR